MNLSPFSTPPKTRSHNIGLYQPTPKARIPEAPIPEAPIPVSPIPESSTPESPFVHHNTATSGEQHETPLSPPVNFSGVKRSLYSHDSDYIDCGHPDGASSLTDGSAVDTDGNSICNDDPDIRIQAVPEDGGDQAASPKQNVTLPKQNVTLSAHSTPAKAPMPANIRRHRYKAPYAHIQAKEGHAVVHISKNCTKLSVDTHIYADDVANNTYGTWLEDHLLKLGTNVNIADTSSKREKDELDTASVRPSSTSGGSTLPTPGIKPLDDLPDPSPSSPMYCIHKAIATECLECKAEAEDLDDELRDSVSPMEKLDGVDPKNPDQQKHDSDGKTDAVGTGRCWYFPPWHYVKEMSATPVRVFNNSRCSTATATATGTGAGAEGTGEGSYDAEPAQESQGNPTIEALREVDFIFQQGDIVCCGLSRNVSGFFDHVNNTLLSLVAYVSCPQKTADIGVPWPDTVTHAGFISFGGNVDKAEMAHNRSHGLKTWSLLEYLEQHSMPIWVIRSPVLATAPGQPHRVYNNVERSIFEAMLDRYALHSAWMKSYLPPAESDKYNFSFLLNFLTLYSEAFRREMERAKKAADERWDKEQKAASEANKQRAELGILQTYPMNTDTDDVKDEVVKDDSWKKALGAEMGDPCSVWRHVLPFGELLAFPPLHALLGGEGAYCSLSVAQFFHDCLLVHCNVDKAIKQVPSLSPFYLGLEKPINNLIQGFDLRHDDGINFKILSPYIVEIIRRLVDAENDLGCTSAVTRLQSKSNVVDNTMLFGDTKGTPTIPLHAQMQDAEWKSLRATRPTTSSSPSVGDLPQTTAEDSKNLPLPVLPSSVWTIAKAKESIKARVQRIRAAVEEELMFNTLLRFHPQHVNEIIDTLTARQDSMLYHLDKHAEGFTDTSTDTLRISLRKTLEGWDEELEALFFKCTARAAQVKKLSIETFQSLHLLMAKSKNAILNEWVHDLHRRSPYNSQENKEKEYMHTSVSGGLFGPGDKATNTEEEPIYKNTEEEEEEQWEERKRCEERRQWDEDILYLCTRYHTDLKAKFEIEFLNFLLDCRVKMIPFLSATTALNTQTTIRNLRKLLKIISPLVQQRLRLRKQEIELAIDAATNRQKMDVYVQVKYKTIPPTLGSILVKQGISPTSTRDSVLVEYLRVSEHSGLVLIAEEEAKSQKRRQCYRDDFISSDDANVPTNESFNTGTAKNSKSGLNSLAASRGYSNASTAGQYARSLDTYNGMFNAHAHLAQKQHDEAKVHYTEMYSGSKRNIPAERIAVERRKRVHRANDAVDAPWVIVLTHILVFYLFTVMYYYWHAHESPFTVPFTYISDVSARVASILTLLGILFISFLFVFHPTLHFCIILALVWNRLMWKSLLRPMALGAVTTVVEMRHHLKVLSESLRVVEITSLFSMILIIVAVLANQNVPSASEPFLSLCIWLVHCTCWALCIISDNVPIYTRMVLDHLFLTLPTAYLLSWHFPINFITPSCTYLHIICFIVFVIYLPKNCTMNDNTWRESFSRALTRLGSTYKAGDLHLPSITLFGIAIWRETRLAKFSIDFKTRLAAFLYRVDGPASTTPSPQPAAPKTTPPAQSTPDLSNPVNSPRLGTPYQRKNRSRTHKDHASEKVKKASNTTSPDTSADTHEFTSASTPCKPTFNKSGQDDSDGNSTNNNNTNTAENTGTNLDGPENNDADIAPGIGDSGRGESQVGDQENSSLLVKLWRSQYARVLHLYAIYAMYVCWLVMLPYDILLARNIVFSILVDVFTQATCRAVVVVLGFQIFIALYYDALCANRYSSMSILRAIRDIRLSLDYDYNQGVVSGTIQPNKDEFSRSIMKDVKRNIMLPQWLRDYARRDAVVYSSSTQET